MSIGSPKSRPSVHPLVSSRSAPQLSSAVSTQVERVEPAPSRTPSPGPLSGRVRQLHPSVPRADASADTKQETQQDTKQETQQDTKHPAGPAPALGNAGRGLVRFVGTFIVDPATSFGQESDALTALTESVQRSVQQQPDTATASSGEVTPREPDSTQ